MMPVAPSVMYAQRRWSAATACGCRVANCSSAKMVVVLEDRGEDDQGAIDATAGGSAGRRASSRARSSVCSCRAIGPGLPSPTGVPFKRTTGMTSVVVPTRNSSIESRQVALGERLLAHRHVQRPRDLEDDCARHTRRG